MSKQIADALDYVARSILTIGKEGAVGMGAMEYHTIEMKEAIGNHTAAVAEVAADVEAVADALNRIADAMVVREMVDKPHDHIHTAELMDVPDEMMDPDA